VSAARRTATTAGMTQPVSRRTVLSGALGGIVTLAGCGNGGGQAPDATRPAPASSSAGPTSGSSSAAPTTAGVPQSATPAQITARANVPVLCWHQLRDWEPSDESYARTLLICPPAHFRAQLDALAEGGWTTIGPDQYFAHLTTGAPLPVKPVLLTFDDSQGSQMTEAFPQLRARGMTATFFAMTVVLDKPGWLSARDLKTLDAAGMTVGAHTWDSRGVSRSTSMRHRPGCWCTVPAKRSRVMVSARRQQALVRGSLLNSSATAAVINTGPTLLGRRRAGSVHLAVGKRIIGGKESSGVAPCHFRADVARYL